MKREERETDHILHNTGKSGAIMLGLNCTVP